MSQRFFRLHNDASSPGRWHLDNPTDGGGRELDDSWQFTDGRPVHIPGRLKVPVEQPGRPLDFTLAGLAIPIVHVRVASVLTELAPADVQLVPVDIDGQPDQYLLFVATRLIRCIDEQASRIRLRGAEEDPPERGWQYASVRDLRIDKTKVGTARVLRPEGWTGALIVSEDLKAAMERLNATGTKFTEV